MPQQGADRRATNDVCGRIADLGPSLCGFDGPRHLRRQRHRPDARKGHLRLLQRLPSARDAVRLPLDAWLDWCEHREAKASEKSAPWTRPAAKVSLRRLEKLRELGHAPADCIDEAVLRGWTGLFPVKPDGTTASGQDVPVDWDKSAQGVTERGKQLGIEQRDGEVFMRFKARVVKAAGPGEAMEEMLREAARFGNSTYEQLYRYFNDISDRSNRNR